MSDCEFDLPHSSAFDSLCSDLKNAFAEDQGIYERVLGVISGYSGERMYFSRRLIRRNRRVIVATGMIRSGMSNREIVSALVERFGISTITARKVRDFAFGQVMREKQMRLDL